MSYMRTMTVRHWLPFVTICPVNKLPDLVYISVEFRGDNFHELYAVRKRIAQAVRAKRVDYMENILQRVADAIPEATAVSLRLLFNRHTIYLQRKINR